MSDIVEITPELAADPEIAFQFFNISEVKRKCRFLQLYMQQIFKNTIQLDKSLILLRHLMVNESSFQILLEQLYLYSQILHATDARRIYKQLLLQLCEKAPAQLRQQLLDYLDEETLNEVGLLNAEAFQRRKRQLNTQLNFVQSKFSLMRDENEGFAKLTVEIAEANYEDDASESRISNILSLIGYFDLDPDRVVDLVIESWLSSPFKFSHLEILRRFKHNSVAHFLGKRYEFLLSSTGNVQPNFGIQITTIDNAYQSILTDPRIPSQNLVLVTAFSIKYKLFELPLIWEYLNPNDQLFERSYADKCDTAYRFYKNFDQLRTIDELNDQENRTDRMRREVLEQFLYNQKLWILQGLLAVNCFDHFKRLYYTIGAMIDLTNFQPLKRTIADFISWVIAPIYKKISYARYFTKRNKPIEIQIPYDPQAPCRQIPQYQNLDESLIDWLEEILQIFAPYLGEFPMLFMKLLRILTEHQQEHMNERIEAILMRVFMPALTPRDFLPVVKLFWKYIQQIDYKKRYVYYSEWKDQQQFATFLNVVRTGDLAKSQLRAVFNKLDKDNKDKMMLRLAKISHNQPILVMNELRRDRVQNSDNNPFMVHALGQVTGFGLDILAYSLVQWLNDFNDERKIRARDIECSQWYKNVASFIGAFYRKYYQVEMQGLFAYICEGLASPQEIKPELLVLKELIEKMTGIVQIEDLSSDQVQSLAGGRYIQLETTHQTSDYKKSRKSNQALENFFWNTTIRSCRLLNQNGEEEEVSLAFLLFIILAQQRTKFLKYYNDQNLRPLSVVFDNFTWSINQLTKCLLFQTDKPTHYAQLFSKNPLQRLVLDFKIPFELAFRVVRYGHKSLYNMTDLEFQEMSDNIKAIWDQIDPMVMYDNPISEETAQLIPNLSHTLIKDKLWENVNPDLFAIFWLLSVDNIYVPTAVYEKQVKTQQENMQKITDPKELARFQKTSAKALEKLQSELENNKKRKEQFDKFLLDKKDCFKFKDDDVETFTLVLSQLCILPRILIDPSEAMYCAKFVHTLIRISKSKYTNTFYIPRDIIYYTLSFLQCATEQESVNLSIFVVLLLQPFANWNDETKYKSDFKQYFDGCEETLGKPQAYEKQKQFIIGTVYLRIFQFIKLLKNNDTQVRNAMIFLKNTWDIFPPTQQIAKLLKEYLNEVQELYQDVQDIKVRISTYRINDRIPLLPDYVCKNLSTITTPKQQNERTEIRSDRPTTTDHRDRNERSDRDRMERDRSDRERNERERIDRERDRNVDRREQNEKESKDRNDTDRKKEKKNHDRNERKEDKADVNHFSQLQVLRKMPKK